MKTRIHNILFPLAIFGVWLISIIALVILSAGFGDHHPNFSAVVSNWDGSWYQSIIANGYSIIPCQQSNVVFFPLYPGVVKLVSLLGLPIPYAAATTSILAFGAALIAIYVIAKKQFGILTARITITLLAFSPFSFFFAISYTESLFLLLTALTLLFTQRKQWVLAALMAGLASSTRFIGLLLTFIVIASYLQEWGWFKKAKHVAPRVIVLSAIGVSGIASFLIYLQVKFGDALAFIHMQQYWPGRGEGIFALKQVAANLIHPSFSNPYFLNITEFVAAIAFFALAIYCTLRVNRWWGLFSLAALAIPLATGTTTSINRYILVLVPCFIAAAHLIKTWDRAIFVVIPSALALAFFFNLFITSKVFLG